MKNSTIQAALIKPGGLCELLLKSRLDAGLNGKGLAEAIGWDPAKVSRTESGRRLPTRDEVEKWISTCRVRGDEAERLRTEIQSLITEYPRAKRLNVLTERRKESEYGPLDSDVSPRTLIDAYQRGYSDALRDVQARISQLEVPPRSALAAAGPNGSGNDVPAVSSGHGIAGG